MVLKIVQLGEEVLRQKARPLTRAEILSENLQRLIADMRDTMRDAPGVGLAAPQVGLSIQLAVIEDPPEYHRDLTPQQLAERERRPVPFHVLINPRVVSRSEPTLHFVEGCLSFAGFAAVVPRFQHVGVEFLNERAEPQTVEASGWYARILQHEIDHLQGNLYVDHMNPRTLATVDNFKRFWKDLAPEEMQKRLG